MGSDYILTLVFILFALHVTSGVRYPCPVNEIYSTCGNAECQRTCLNPLIYENCTKIKTPGCICQPNLLRNSQGICVPILECNTCKENEIYSICGKNACENTCAEKNAMARCIPRNCIPGCICRPGFFRNDKQKCVSEENCTMDCGGDPNAEFSECGDACPITCFNKDSPPPCEDICQVGGSCKCKQGYVRDHKRRCVLPDQCPKCDGVNEVYACGSPCDRTCTELNTPCPITSLRCIEMCYCKDGYARNSNDTCIPISECPQICPTDVNAIILSCGDPCPMTCENKNDPAPKPCKKKCIKNGCKCIENHVLDASGVCVPIENCPVPKCGPNEMYDPCPPQCPPELTCSNYKAIHKCKPTNNTKCKPACRCEPGYARGPKNRCILLAQCWKDPNALFV